MSPANLMDAVGRSLAVWLSHGVWQTSVIALVAGAVLWMLRRHSARARYVVGYIALAALVLSPSATLLLPPPAPMESSSPALGEEEAATPEAVSPSATPAPLAWVQARTQGPEISAVAARLPLLLVAAWLAGSCGVALSLLLGWRSARQRLLGDARPAPTALQQSTTRVAVRLGLSQAVEVLESPHAPSPLVIGVVRPMLVLPLGLGEQLPAQQLEAVLAHELSHVRRHDTLANLAQCLVEVLFFFHPAARWLSSRVRLEREHCCDDTAVQLCGSARVYSSALLGLEELRQVGPALQLGASSHPLLARVQRLLGKTPTSEPWGRRALRAGMALGVLAVSGGAWAWDGPTASSGGSTQGGSILAPSACTKSIYPKDFTAIATYRMEGRDIRNRIFVSHCGRVRLEPANGARVPTLLYDVSSHELVSLDTEERSYEQVPRREPMGLPLHMPGACTEARGDCSLEGEEELSGRHTQRLLRKFAPHDTVKTWVDRELGYPIREEASLFGTLKLEDIQVTNLDPGLFHVPGNFREVSSP